MEKWLSNRSDLSKKVFAFACVVFVAIALSRSVVFMFDDQQRALTNSIFLLHISPVFSPFSTFDTFENTRSSYIAYQKEKGGGYRPIDLQMYFDVIGGPHVAKYSVSSSIANLPKHEALGQKEAAFSVIRAVFCTPYSIEEVRVDIYNKKTRALTHQYTIPCHEDA